MPQWTNQIPETPSAHALPLMRTPPHGAIVAIATSPALLGTYTHYWKGRTIPCESPHCEPCLNGLPYRWHAYLGAYLQGKALHCLFECTAQAAEAFAQYTKANGTLRGCMFQASRWRQTPNGRVLIQTKPADLTKIILPQPPNIIAALSIIWHLPLPATATTRNDPDRNARHISAGPAGELLNRLPESHYPPHQHVPPKNGDD